MGFKPSDGYIETEGQPVQGLPPLPKHHVPIGLLCAPHHFTKAAWAYAEHYAEDYARAALAATPAPAEPEDRKSDVKGALAIAMAYATGEAPAWAATPAAAPHMLQGEDPRIEPVRNVVERLCGTRQSAENFARRILAAADSATPAPAPQAVRPYEPTEAMRWAAKRIDPAMTHEHIGALWRAMWSAAPEAGQGKEASK